MDNAKEQESQPDHMLEEVLIFDVDGVLTVPDSREFDRQLMELIAQKLNTGEPVILNTGRSISWVQQRIISRLYNAHEAVRREAFQNLFVVGEKGGTWLTFDDDGMMHEEIDSSISVPEDLQIAIRRVIEERFPKTMFFDKTKRTMVSVEMNEINDTRIEGENSLERFKEDQLILVQVLADMLKKRGITNEFKIDPTIIATDVENNHVGKGFAMHRVVDWLNQREIKAKKFITFGDSSSDIHMAEWLDDHGENVEFVNVGENKALGSTHDFPITSTVGNFNKGTLEYFHLEHK